jgi:hypothetical protein
MRRYHHIGIPTNESRPGETHLKHLKLFVVSHEKSEFGVEWMRFEADAAVPDLVRRVPHVAFEVTDLSSELAGREILIPPNSPSEGVRVAFIVENGAPIELLEFTDPKHPARLSNQTESNGLAACQLWSVRQWLLVDFPILPHRVFAPLMHPMTVYQNPVSCPGVY